ENIWHKIRRARICIVIELRTNRAEARRKSDVVADKLVGVFNTCADCPMLIDVVSDSKLCRSRVSHADAEVLIFVVRDGQIGRYWADALAVRRQPAPRLSA